MKEHQFADTFAQAPCNEDYAGVVRKPMDLESIRKGIDSGEISDIKELERDVSLVFLNSTMSNKSGSKVSAYYDFYLRQKKENFTHSLR